MSYLQHSVETTVVPEASALRGLFPILDLADAYAAPLPAGTTSNPEELAKFIFERPPAWIAGLMAIRDVLVTPFGITPSTALGSPEGRVGIFRIFERRDDEIVLGENDAHLDFRLSVKYESASPEPRRPARAVVSTVVHCHNALGRRYLALILPFHKLVVKAFLRNAARKGWPVHYSG